MSQTSKNDYGTVRLKTDTVTFLKDLREAFEDSYQRKFTMDEFIRLMADSIEDGDPGVWEIYCMKQEQKIQLQQKIKECQNLRNQSRTKHKKISRNG